MAAKWQGTPKLWRVRGESSDGLVVTIGKYDTETAARADAEKAATVEFYRNIKVEPIEPADASTSDVGG